MCIARGREGEDKRFLRLRLNKEKEDESRGEERRSVRRVEKEKKKVSRQTADCQSIKQIQFLL